MTKPTKPLVNRVLSEETDFLNFSNKVLLLTSSGQMSAAYLTDAVYNWIAAGLQACIIDLTGDIVLSGKQQLLNNTTLRSYDLLRTVQKQGVLSKVGNALLTPCLPFHDIAILGKNWGKLLRDVSQEIPKGMPIILLLGGIDRFTTKYLMNKFSDRYDTMVYMVASAVNPTQTIAELKLVAASRVSIVVTNVTEQLQVRIKPLVQQYPTTKAFKMGATVPLTVVTEHLK